MKVNIVASIDMKAAIKLYKQKNKSKYINKLILNDVNCSEQTDGIAKEEEKK